MPPLKLSVPAYLRDELGPRLHDRDWLLHEGKHLIKIRGDELVLEVGFDAVNDMLSVWVAIEPLYCPVECLGSIDAPICTWMKGKYPNTHQWCVDRPLRREETTAAIAEAINTRVAPLFAQLTDSQAVLDYYWQHPTDPFLSWVERGGRWNDALGYLYAWCNRPGRADLHLRAVQKRLAQQWDEDEDTERYRAHVTQTQALLRRPEELREFLSGTAREKRERMQLDRAAPLVPREP